MERFSALLTLCAGTRSFDVFFIWAWINGWVNNGEAGGLRRQRAYHDVTVMNFNTWEQFS